MDRDIIVNAGCSGGRRHSRSAAVVSCVFGLLLAAATPARAESTGGFDVRLDAPPQAGCVSARELIAQVEQRTGRSARGAAAGGPRVTITVLLSENGSGHGARVLVADERSRALGSRELQAEGACSELDDMLVLVIASALGVSSLEPRARSEPVQPPPRDAHIDTDDDEQGYAPTVMELEPAADLALDIEAAGRLFTGTFPALHGAAGLGVRLERGALSLRVSATMAIPTTEQLQLDQQLSLTGALGQLDGCGQVVRAWRGRLHLCMGVQVGAMRAEATTLWRSTPRWDLILQLVPSLWLSTPLFARFGLGVGLGAAIPLRAPRYSYVDPGGNTAPLYTIGLGGFAELAFWLRFGA